MAIVTSEQSTANKDYLRRLLRHRQPDFSAALELAVDLLGQELHRAETPRYIGASEGACPGSPAPLPASADLAQVIAGHFQLRRLRSSGRRLPAARLHPLWHRTGSGFCQPGG